jgi:hypothetical protein
MVHAHPTQQPDNLSDAILAYGFDQTFTSLATDWTSFRRLYLLYA